MLNGISSKLPTIISLFLQKCNTEIRRNSSETSSLVVAIIFVIDNTCDDLLLHDTSIGHIIPVNVVLVVGLVRAPLLMGVTNVFAIESNETDFHNRIH